MDDPVVVVGLSFEFPQGANSTKTFFDILREGRCTMTEVPGDRFNIDAFYHPDPDRLDTVGFEYPNTCVRTEKPSCIVVAQISWSAISVPSTLPSFP